MSLRQTISRLSTTTAKLIEKQGTDSFFVLRETRTQTGKGGTTKAYTATTATAIPCFYSVVQASAEKLEEWRAAQRKPVIFRRFVCKATVDVKQDDRLRLVARDSVPQIDMEIMRIAPLSGLMLEIITAEEILATP